MKAKGRRNTMSDDYIFSSMEYSIFLFSILSPISLV